MKKFAFFTFMVLGLLCSTNADAKNPPNGVYNYVNGSGDLMVWWNDHYHNFGHVDLP